VTEEGTQDSDGSSIAHQRTVAHVAVLAEPHRRWASDFLLIGEQDALELHRYVLSDNIIEERASQSINNGECSRAQRIGSEVRGGECDGNRTAMCVAEYATPRCSCRFHSIALPHSIVNGSGSLRPVTPSLRREFVRAMVGECAEQGRGDVRTATDCYAMAKKMKLRIEPHEMRVFMNKLVDESMVLVAKDGQRARGSIRRARAGEGPHVHHRLRHV
jgi:hypothetical protein